MKTFLIIFRCQTGSERHNKWLEYSTEEKKSALEIGLSQQENWFRKHEQQVIFNCQGLSPASVFVDAHGVSNSSSLIGKFLIFQAASIEETVEIFRDHPHHTIFPGDGIEIVEFANSAN